MMICYFNFIFISACIAGTGGIILVAPSLYDTRQPLDALVSKVKRINKFRRLFFYFFLLKSWSNLMKQNIFTNKLYILAGTAEIKTREKKSKFSRSNYLKLKPDLKNKLLYFTSISYIEKCFCTISLCQWFLLIISYLRNIWAKTYVHPNNINVLKNCK